MEITTTLETKNRSAKTTIGDFDYVLNYVVNESKLASANGQINKKGVNIGSFNIPDLSNSTFSINYNFSNSSLLVDRQTVINDVDAIYNQLLTDVSA
jgi:hypothetical protein